jgi:cytochrome c-type biogenesis protein CcmH/NrfG
VEAEHFDKAEANVKQALAVDAEDAYCLYVLGILRFRQGKYDEALDALSHSAKIDPQNPEVQNYLGLALS